MPKLIERVAPDLGALRPGSLGQKVDLDLKPPPHRFQLQLPAEEYEQLQLTVERMIRRKKNGESKLKKEPSAAKIVRVALRQLLGSTTTEQLEELIETTDL